ncbi:MAG: hypothetical protein Q4G43_02145 [Mobilicoccus sp.]|nr:hypothetical protein [Mobilicoccus sp.]
MKGVGGVVALAGVALVAGGCSVADSAPRTSTLTTGAADPDSDELAEMTYIPECTPDTLAKRPESYVLACADGSEILSQLQWRAWGEESATATGNLVTNDCVPTCADGNDMVSPVRVVVDQRTVDADMATYQRLTITVDTGDGQGERTVFTLPEKGVTPPDLRSESPPS